MYNVLIIDNSYAEAAYLAELLGRLTVPCRVLDIVPVGFVGSQRFFTRRPDVVFLDSALCDMRIDEFIDLSRKAVHPYRIVLLGEDHPNQGLPAFCVSLPREDLSEESLNRLFSYFEENGAPDHKEDGHVDAAALVNTLLKDQSMDTAKAIAEQLNLPRPFSYLRILILELWELDGIALLTKKLDNFLIEKSSGRAIGHGSFQIIILLSGKNPIDCREVYRMICKMRPSGWHLLEGDYVSLMSISNEVASLKQLVRSLYFVEGRKLIPKRLLLRSENINELLLQNLADKTLVCLFQLDEEGVSHCLREIYLTELSITGNFEDLQKVRMYVTLLSRTFRDEANSGTPHQRFWPNQKFHCLLEEFEYVEACFTNQIREYRDSEALYSPLVQDAVSYVNQHLFSALSLNEVAQAVSVSKEHLSTSFTKQTGIRMSDFILQKKMQIARYLLSSDRKVREIAQILGYSDMHYFERVFKKNIGMTPSQYQAEDERYKEVYRTLNAAEISGD